MSEPSTIEDLRGSATDVGESSDEIFTFEDATGAQLDADALKTITMTLMDETNLASINSRNAQSVKNEAGGTLASDGTLTVRFGAADNINANSTAVGTLENHLIVLTWTWDDGVVSDRVGIKVFRKQVNPVPVAAS